MANCWRCLDKGWYLVARLIPNPSGKVLNYRKQSFVGVEWTAERKPCGSCHLKPDDYTLEHVKANPIPARCLKCNRLWVEGNGNGPIYAPGLSNCACFYCHGKLQEIELEPPEKKTLKTGTAVQPSLF